MAEIRSKTLQRKLQDDQKCRNIYCDFTIRYEDQEFHVHKCVLGVFSDFFKTMFVSRMKEKYENEVKLPEVSAKTMRIVIEFLYDDDVKVNRENVYNLLSAADFLQISVLKKACRDYLENNFSDKTAIKDWVMLRRYQAQSQSVETKIVENGASIFKQKAVLELDENDFEILLSLTKMHIAPSVRYKYIMNWIEHDCSVRMKYLDSLIEHVDFSLLPKKFLTEIVSRNEVIRKSATAMARILDAVCQFCTDNSSNGCKVAFFTSCDDEDQLHQDIQKLRMFSAEAIGWKELASFPWKHRTAGILIQNDRIYMLGGHQAKSKSSKKVKYLNLYDVSSDWTDMTSMHTARRTFACTVYKDSIYVAGGRVHDSMWTKQVECYDFESGTWFQKAGMIQRRARHATVAHRGLLYALGGEPNRSSALESVEYYDGISWKEAASMNKPRYDFSAVVLNDQVYAIGGGDEDDLTSVELYDLRANAWHDVASMTKQRHGHVYACVANGKIYAMDDKDQSVEVYDPIVDEWSDVTQIPGDQTNDDDYIDFSSIESCLFSEDED
ncbi:ectoderm-neural cortex protein 1-like [Clavelina lepadiformis]|uniref:ectoderm-neural cortex protein 1-like n=1 Tax=Clavelina lepadiformis TaxID=159417 RepID=UPI004041E0B8